MSRVAALACCAALAAPASAHAADASWPAAPVSEAGAQYPTELQFAADGSGLLTWEGYVPGHTPRPKLTGLVLRAPLGAWTRGPDVPGVTWGLARVHAAGTRAVLVGMRAYRFVAFNRARWEVVTATGGLDGRFGPVRTITRDVRWVGSAAGGRGEVLAAWLARRDDRVRVVRVRPARGRTTVLSSPAVHHVTLAIGPRGDVLVAWLRRGRIEARLRTPAGRWGPVRRIAPAGPRPEALHAASNRRGEAIVAWGAFTRVGEGEPGRWAFRAATSDGGAWTTHRLDRFAGRDLGALPATALPVFDARGRGLVAWAGRGAVTVARPDGTARRSVAAPPSAVVDDIALSRTGELAVTLSVPPPPVGAGAGPFVITAPPADPLGSLTDLAVPDSAALRGTQVAFDPLTAQPTVAWVSLQDSRPRLWTASRKIS